METKHVLFPDKIDNLSNKEVTAKSDKTKKKRLNFETEVMLIQSN